MLLVDAYIKNKAKYGQNLSSHNFNLLQKFNYTDKTPKDVRMIIAALKLVQVI